MPGVFIGSTELTTVGDIKIGATDVQEVYVGATKVFPTGAVLTPIFDWNPQTAQALPDTSTFTRASVAPLLTTTDGTTNWYQQAKSGEVRLEGLRRVENLLDSSTGTGPFTAITKDGRLAVSVIADTGTLTITIGGTPQVFTPTGTPQRFVAFDDATGGSTSVAISGTATLSQPMAHLCQVGNDIPEPYVQHDAESLNIGVNGVTYFNTANTSTVDGSGVVTEATGTTITGGGYLPEPAATNNITDSDDYNAASWARDGFTSVTDDGTNSLGLRQHTLILNTATGEHRIYDTSVAMKTVYFIVKQGPSNPVRYVIIRAGGSSDYVAFDLQTVSVTELGGGNVAGGRIDLIDDGFYVVQMTRNTSGTDFAILGISDTGTPGTADPSFTGASEQLLVCQAQAEAADFSTSPIVTSGGTSTRVADSLTDVDWPATASAVIDTTVNNVIPGGTIDNQQNMLGFGSNSAHSFVLSAPTVARIFTGGINSFITASSSYESERHGFGMSFQVNEGIVVDDEDNDNTDVTGTPGGGAIQIGLNSGLVGVPGKYHRVRIYDQIQSVEELKAEV